MKKQIIFTAIPLCYILFFSSSVKAQSNGDSLFNHQTILELKNDTLYYGNGIKFYTGQQLLIGKAAGSAGYYRSIIHKKAALVPSIWGQDKNYDHAIENHVNKKKSREIVRKTVVEGNLVTITKIFFSKTAKPYFYMASLSSGQEGFNCDITLALILKELVLQQ
ncbi:MAG: hypothetical protein H7Y86_20025 [Rhizobacter sp.]|nr:hypothetical protein [Ferruginibacter sp.]